MSYNSDSYMAGLALGRLLWRPPSVMTALGWDADRRCLTFRANTVLASADHSSRTPYIKTNDGWAICVIAENTCDSQFGGNWAWVYVISTYEAATKFHIPGFSEIGTLSYQYLGLKWYITASAQNARYGGATELHTAFPKIDFGGRDIATINGTGLFYDPFVEIMQAMHVRRVTA